MDQDKTPKELIEELYVLFSTFKQRMEDPNFIQVENTLTQLMENQMEMKTELRELKKQLLNPYDGVIVETKKNTEYRESMMESQKENEKLSQFIGQPVTELKIELGMPDKQENKILIYNTKKYGIPCERKFEIDDNQIVTGFISKGCF